MRHGEQNHEDKRTLAKERIVPPGGLTKHPGPPVEPVEDGENEEDQPVLSHREREVLHHFSNGLTYVQTAHRMGITTGTVDTYLRRIRAKAGVFSGAELIRLAVALELRESSTAED